MKKNPKNKIFAILSGFVLLAAGLVFGVAVGNQEKFPPDIPPNNPTSEEATADAAPDQFIVKFKSAVSQTEKNNIISREKTTLKKEIGKISTDVLKTPAGKNSHEMVSTFRQQYGDKIEFAELDIKATPSFTPNDPEYSKQWALPKIEAPAGWDITRGSNSVTIAVLDTGVNINHSDLKNKLVAGWNVVDNNTDLTDLNGHGTMMMGIAGAQTNNTLGIAGVGIEPKIMMIRICNNAEGWAYYSDMAEAIIYGADHGVKVESISFGGSSPSVAVQNAIDYAYSKGTFVTAAAGNSGSSSPGYPAASNHVVAVGATDANDQKASWSNWGSWVDVTAPGVSIQTTNRSGGYSVVSGTSPATPHVAGIAALLLSRSPSLTPSQIESTIELNSNDLGSTGKDDIFGWGRINLRKAVAAVGSPAPTPTPAPPQSGGIAGKALKASDSTPIVSAKIVALQGGKTIAQASTLSNGTYQLNNLAAGTYDVSASASNFQSEIKKGITVTQNVMTNGVDFKLQDIVGTGTVSGRIFDERKKPVYRAKVTLKLLSTPRRKNLGSEKNIWTDRDGNFSYKNVEAGVYLLIASNRARFAFKEIGVTSSSNSYVNLTLQKRNILKWVKSILAKYRLSR